MASQACTVAHLWSYFSALGVEILWGLLSSSLSPASYSLDKEQSFFLHVPKEMEMDKQCALKSCDF